MCRACVDLPYRCQSEGVMDRSIRRIRRLRRKLGGSGNLLEDVPFQPGNIRNSKYLRQYWEQIELERAHWRELKEKLDALRPAKERD